MCASLEHVVERALLENNAGGGGERLRFTIRPLPGKEEGPREEKGSIRREMHDWPTLREWEDRYIRDVLEHCGGKLTGAGSATAVLDIHYSTLRTRMRKMGISLPGSPADERPAADSCREGPSAPRAANAKPHMTEPCVCVFCRCETAPVLRRNQSRPRGLPTSSMSAVMTATQHRAMSMPGLNMSNMR